MPTLTFPMFEQKMRFFVPVARSFSCWVMVACIGIAAPLFAAQNVVVVLDDSGSMAQGMQAERTLTRIQAAKGALSKVVQGLPDDTQIGILLLNSEGRGNHWLVPLGPLSASVALPKIASIKADGGTPLGSQMKIAADALLDARQKQIYGEYRLLVITDGEASDANILETYLPDILARGISLDVIGVDMASNHSLAKRAHSYRRADDAAGFERALTEIFAESNNANDQQANDEFEMIAALPDELASQVLTNLAVPNNNQIGYVPPSSPADSVVANSNASNPGATPLLVPRSGSTPPVIPGPTSPIKSLIRFLAALPCGLTIVVLIAWIIAINMKKRK